MKREHVGECGPQHVAPTKGTDWRSCLRGIQRRLLTCPYLLPIRTPLGPTTSLPVHRFPLSTLKHNRYLFFLNTRHQQFAGANYPIFHAFSKRCRFVPSFHYLLLCFFLLLSCDIILFLSLRGSPEPVAGLSRRFDLRGVAERESERFHWRRTKMAVSKVVLMALAVLVFVVALPAVRAQSIAPAPAPTSDGITIDQGIAYVLMLLALVLTYIIH